MRSFIRKMSSNRKRRTEKARPACEEMKDSRRREVGVEARRLHIVYFLSRNGKIEQPHLIRVHHLSNNGVHLRDVKRWLSELRGKEMPESFSWSFKRSYKTDHIWQDLTDNDLITPFSDNEYILKGSLIPSPQNKTIDQFFETSLLSIKQDKEEDDENKNEKEREEEAYNTLHIEDNFSPKPPSPSSSFEETIRNKRVVSSERRGGMKNCNEVVLKKSGSQISKSNGKGGGEDRRGRRAADVIMSLLRCRLVEIKECLKRERCKQNGSISQKNYQTSNNGGSNERKSWEKKGSNGGSRRMTEKSTPAIYKPAKEPNCSQCGKPFKPEKLHSHMKSCTVLKERVKSSSFNKEQTAARRPSKVTVTVL